jgi:hypothetical protein
MKSKCSSHLFAILLAVIVIGCRNNDREVFFKGNMHTHSFWSDGNAYPQEIARWYRDHGYQFLVVTDHNTLQEGIKKRAVGEDTVVLAELAAYRQEFDKPGEFILISGEELSDAAEKKPVHLGGIGLKQVVKPAKAATVMETLSADVSALSQALEPVGYPEWVIVNHPNFGWGLSTDALARCGTRFFEVFNGHPSVRNYGDSVHISTELMWDQANKWRIDQGQKLILGIATDDAHNYDRFEAGKANPGRGWTLVRAEELTPDALYKAMCEGDFYASTGVELLDFKILRKGISILIKEEAGIKYITEFIGWLPGKSEPEILKTVEGTKATYHATGKELFVRTHILSSKPKDNPFKEGDYETAWLQPVSFRK